MSENLEKTEVPVTPSEPAAISGNESTFMNKKIRLQNVPKFLSPSVLRQAVAEHLKVPTDCITCRKSDKWTYAIIAFKSAGPLALLGIDALLEKISGMKYRKYDFVAKIEEEREQRTFQPRQPAEGMPEKSLCDQVTPLWNLPYNEQLEKKQFHMRSVLQKFFKTSGKDISGLDSILHPIEPSPVQDEYRNKCEFSIGFDKTGSPTVGFNMGGYRDGLLITENARACLHVPGEMKVFANYLQDFINRPENLAAYPVFDRVKKDGFWRLMMCRLHSGVLMVVIQVQDSPIIDKTEFIEKIKNMVETFNNQGFFQVESVFVQYTKMLHHGLSTTEPYELVPGFKSTLIERLSKLQFQISPSSFFQVNLPATGLLYDKIKEFATEELVSEKKPVLLDVCCGTGTIGMIMASNNNTAEGSVFERVIGIEMVPSAVEDAKLNAKLNEISGIEFHCSRVELCIKDIINSLPADTPIVAVLDPPRSGVHSDVIKTLRSCERLRRLVYVSCNPDAAVGNWVDLQRPTSKSFQHAPFQLTKALPVDMFPHTEHCELILRFDRN